MRPPMLAGPMPRNTKRLSKGSLDQFTGVGVGLGVAVALRDGAGDWAGSGVCEAVGCCACAATNPKVITTIKINRKTYAEIAGDRSFILGSFPMLVFVESQDITSLEALLSRFRCRLRIYELQAQAEARLSGRAVVPAKAPLDRTTALPNSRASACLNATSDRDRKSAARIVRSRLLPPIPRRRLAHPASVQARQCSTPAARSS